MMSRLWVDPPEGWKYGFPAIYDPVNDGKMRDWIISKGYPLQIIKEYGKQWMVRSWSAEEPDEKKYPDKDISAQKQSKDVKNAPIGTDLPKKTHRKVTVSEVLEELNFAKLRIQELRDRIDVLEKTEQEPWRESASDYERGFIDGMQKQRQSSVDKAVNRMAQPEQEPVAYLSNKRQRINIEIKPQTFVEIPTVTDWEMPLYMKPPQRTWVGLTDEEMLMIYGQDHEGKKYNLGRMVQQALKDKNT